MQKKVFDIWSDKIIERYRKKLLQGDRDISPCNKCNAEGTVLGKIMHKRGVKFIQFK